MRIRVCWYKNAGVAGYAEAFRPVQSDSQASEWYSYFENDVLVFFYMIPSLIDDGADMVIRKGIENGFPFSAAFYQFVLLQDAELMRDRSLAHFQRCRNVADAALLVRQAEQDANARGIREDLEQVCKIVDQFFIIHFLGNLR